MFICNQKCNNLKSVCLVSGTSKCLGDKKKHLPWSESCAYDFFALQKEASHPPLLLPPQTGRTQGGPRLQQLVPHQLFLLYMLIFSSLLTRHNWFFSTFLSSLDINLREKSRGALRGGFLFRCSTDHLCLAVPHCALLHPQLKG